ncbi:hypothetical protein Kpol_1059p42 [Vanderwaltozyma polyspora DSM 70294]|uniref:Uncharacterized protein n=1 Tax=Vanderwaltozyma polyspora (strain ATCC 22028 / DSM 70294 / BCRC 21397 / CBS 2163 / NBRC 10782 / NRRL Y-8283 / UCD 57-17) TaxID=436907 RepID=A7TN45_VANPO|nr:uncharacterized protein Kpol_1059p42 [Vanderwaltozyma polyspora DSM 70294]EDO16351.1 hypothetical protein Kpol_1059p42 [Vanderwaltozyma polyspora DSM 70294]
MSTFIRGPICGTDNCPSRLWRIIDGRRTCQYGHVMEGDVEYNDDDDVGGGAITRRLNLTTNATGNFQSSFNASQMMASQKIEKDKKIYGYEANLLFLKAFQYILRRQCKWLIQEKGFPEYFKKVVKIIWVKYVLYISENDEGNDHTFSDDERDKVNRYRYSKKSRKPLGLHMTSTLAILYIATVHCGLPIFMCDYLNWICSSNLPYFKSSMLLPKVWREKLPNYYIGIFDGGSPPSDGKVYQKVANLCNTIKFSAHFNSKFMYPQLLLKLVIENSLPPEFYLITVQLIGEIDSMEYMVLTEDNSKEYKKFHQSAEIRTISYFLLTLRWILFANLGEKCSIEWINGYLKKIEAFEKSAVTNERNISNIMRDDKNRDVFNWDSKDSIHYLDWVEKKFLPTQSYPVDDDPSLGIDLRIARRQLYKLLPLNIEGTLSDREITIPYTEELQQKYIQVRNNIEASLTDDLIKENGNSREYSILQLEESILSNISIDFGISKEQLKGSIEKVQASCMDKFKEQFA